VLATGAVICAAGNQRRRRPIPLISPHDHDI